MRIDRMDVESQETQLAIDVSAPAFRWSFAEEQERGRLQAAYRIVVAENEREARSGAGTMWDSGFVASANSSHVPYDGRPLKSRTRYYWRVEVREAAGEMCTSEVSWFETALMNPSDWLAAWMGVQAGGNAGVPPGDEAASTALPLYRTEFKLGHPVKSARVYLCGLGHYELRLNGRKVGDRVLEPGWTNYHRTCLYSVYDVTAYLKEGVNAAGVLLGNGFYHVTGGRYTKYKGSFGRPKCLLQLEAELTDGSRVTVVSGDGWRTAAGPITFSCIYGGEDYDARLERHGWDRAGYAEDGSWTSAPQVEPPAGKLRAQAAPPLQVRRTYRPADYSQPTPGVYVADLGQNMSGWVRIKVRGAAGTRITISPGELLREDGTVNQKWTGSPYRFHYTLRGEGEEIWSPRFTYYGFRYVQVEGAVPSWGSDASAADTAEHANGAAAELLELEGCMIYPGMGTAGSFECSDALLNRTHDMINMAILSNTKSIFTDCPHREKLGWLEQVHLMGPSAALNHDIERLLAKTMEDIRDAQLPSGMVPTTAPEYVVFPEPWEVFRDSVSWGAAYVLTGWNLLTLYGRRRILEEHFAGMKAYVDYVSGKAKEHLVDYGLGDWYDAGPGGPGFTQNTPVALTETAMYYHMTEVFAGIAQLLGHHEDASCYRSLCGRIKLAFQQAFFDPQECRYAGGSQTSYAMPLVLGLAAEEHKPRLLAGLIEVIRLQGLRTTAGDVGHRYVLHALMQSGHSDLVYGMARQSEHPGYAYQIKHGATTLTEAWDGPTVGKSQNHFMLGHIEEWFYAGLAGISYRFDPETERFALELQPAFPEGVTYVRASHRLPCGTVRVAWERLQDGGLVLEADIPVNCTAELRLPASSMDAVKESGSALPGARGIGVHGWEAGCAVLKLGSGAYRFRSVV
ncbi:MULTISPECIES: family 78 glycoside hydrolase catalytic domain [Paenibacillus]|uniref:family 78 glycoside hydrolase catalytic domain n=1 Tax=Paenibacillus TaxID=44249 RepID=UPI0022B85833|nr:family 78 glycoside hydrolase catalytic domain [Paenibacillus caseinilyticus]MCZ8519551.1 family 78 glycoside hydrolase catalytic domain [Paenibacillus caseinilyticus]